MLQKRHLRKIKTVISQKSGWTNNKLFQETDGVDENREKNTEY